MFRTSRSHYHEVAPAPRRFRRDGTPQRQQDRTGSSIASHKSLYSCTWNMLFKYFPPMSRWRKEIVKSFDRPEESNGHTPDHEGLLHQGHRISVCSEFVLLKRQPSFLQGV